MILKIETYNGKFDNEIISLILSLQNDEAKRILVSNDEIRFAENGSLMNRIRYNKEWWNGTKLDGFDWNGTDGPVQKSLEKVTVMDQRTKSKH